MFSHGNHAGPSLTIKGTSSRLNTSRFLKISLTSRSIHSPPMSRNGQRPGFFFRRIRIRVWYELKCLICDHSAFQLEMVSYLAIAYTLYLFTCILRTADWCRRCFYALHWIKSLAELPVSYLSYDRARIRLPFNSFHGVNEKACSSFWDSQRSPHIEERVRQCTPYPLFPSVRLRLCDGSCTGARAKRQGFVGCSGKRVCISARWTWLTTLTHIQFTVGTSTSWTRCDSV